MDGKILNWFFAVMYIIVGAVFILSEATSKELFGYNYAENFCISLCLMLVFLVSIYLHLRLRKEPVIKKHRLFLITTTYFFLCVLILAVPDVLLPLWHPAASSAAYGPGEGNFLYFLLAFVLEFSEIFTYLAAITLLNVSIGFGIEAVLDNEKTSQRRF